MIHPINIGQVCLDNNLILAPMAGVSDPPFRLLCHEKGAGLVCTEMISAKALFFRNKKTDELMITVPEERPVSLQIFGSDPECMAQIAKEIDNRPFDILDINMGCPVPKIVKNGDGSALMKAPKLVEKIVSQVVKATTKPVTVKIRKGFDEEHKNATEIAKIIEASGASAIAVHGRTREEMYSGRADRECIRAVKESVKIPVISNGDIDGFESLKDMNEQTGCDGFMIGRAAQGNPWIFENILRQKEGLSARKISSEEIIKTVLRHAKMQIDLRGEYIAIRQLRKHASWYCSGYPGAAALRGRINSVETYDELEKVMLEISEASVPV